MSLWMLRFAQHDMGGGAPIKVRRAEDATVAAATTLNCGCEYFRPHFGYTT